MADTKISALTAVTPPLAGTEVLPIVQSGITKKVSVDDLTAGRAVSAASLALTGTPLPVTSGGTGNSSWTSYGLVYASGATTLTNGSALTFDGTTLKNKNSSSGVYMVLENSDPSIGGGEAIQLQFNYTTVTSLSTNWLAISRYAGANFQFISDTNGAGGVVRFTLDAGNGNAYVETGNLVFGTSGKGIDFSASSHAAGMTSELLNDYEEGTWTPGMTASSSGSISLNGTYTVGRYTKVGRQVTCVASLYVASVSTPTGNLYITGLPFTVAAPSSAGSFWGNNFTASAAGPLVLRIDNSSTRVLVQGFAAGVVVPAASWVKAGTEMNVTLTYFV